MYSIKTKNLTLNKNQTYVMGVLNITPDSFSDGGDFLDTDSALSRAIEIQEQGADIIDIGAQSTRPGFEPIDEETEWRRLESPLRLIRENISLPISIDTFYPYVALRSIDLGADIINDISGFKNKKMIKIVAASSASLIVMHDGPLSETRSFLHSKLNELILNLIEKDRICFDPGIGFGKSQEENLRIIKDPLKFSVESNFTLVGASRKRVTSVAYCEEIPPKERLTSTITAHTIMAINGANIIRVHDVKEAVQCTKMVNVVKSC
ncbi:MAG: dihydropteroate synthase [Oscillospiraceae bacterium]|nr:dihydropteroate synthase [Oscillospiraceae bacterium]